MSLPEASDVCFDPKQILKQHNDRVAALKTLMNEAEDAALEAEFNPTESNRQKSHEALTAAMDILQTLVPNA